PVPVVGPDVAVAVTVTRIAVAVEIADVAVAVAVAHADIAGVYSGQVGVGQSHRAKRGPGAETHGRRYEQYEGQLVHGPTPGRMTQIMLPEPKVREVPASGQWL